MTICSDSFNLSNSFLLEHYEIFFKEHTMLKLVEKIGI
jgi:hypothetical protein